MLILFATAFSILMTSNPNISEVKQEIRESVYTVEPANQDLAATLIAIASIETKNMSIDYPVCDGKKGEACNVGIYKMNLFQRRKACPEIPKDEINKDIKKATLCMIKGLDLYRYDLWMSWHRGGEGWKNYQVEVKDYKAAIEVIKDKYLNTKNALTDDTRYTVNLPAI